LQEISWYPREKIEIVKEKLVGINPARIAIRELKKSKHDKKVNIIPSLIKFIALHEDACEKFRRA
jgi:hypothetical protein